MAFCTGIRFYKEQVNIKLLLPDTIEVHGKYFFKNENAHSIANSIFYPFPTDSGLEPAQNIVVSSALSGEHVPFTLEKDRIQWLCVLPAFSCDTIDVLYRQKSRTFSGRYIVTTTRFWGQPLESARFSLTVPQPAILAHLSFPSDSINVNGDTLVYNAYFLEFMPEQDVLFSWKLPKTPLHK